VFWAHSGILNVGSGQLSEKELRAALVNGDWTSFDPHTVRMMIRLQFPFPPDELCLIYIDSTCTGCSILIVPVQSASMNSGPSPSLPQLIAIVNTPYSGLWGFLAAWRSLFDRFDEDGSGNISIQEFSHALTGIYFLRPSVHLFSPTPPPPFSLTRGQLQNTFLTNTTTAFGYRLSPQFIQLLFRSYDRRGQESSPQSAVQQGGDGCSLIDVRLTGRS